MIIRPERRIEDRASLNSRIVDKPDNETPAATCDSLNFLFARDPGAIRKSRSTSGLPGTNLLDEWIGDLLLVAGVVARQLEKITCPTGGNTSRTGSNGNPHPPAPDARASAVTARAPAQVALAL